MCPGALRECFVGTSGRAAFGANRFPETVNGGSAKHGSTPADGGIAQLFTLDHAGTTLLLWSSFFFTFMILVTNSAWTPTLLRTEGLPIEHTALLLATFNFCSLLGSSAAGLLLTRFGILAVLPGAVAGSALAYALVGYDAPSLTAVTLCQGLFGLFAGCASSGLIAFAATLYPAAFRATGVGYAMAADAAASCPRCVASRRPVGAPSAAGVTRVAIDEDRRAARPRLDYLDSSSIARARPLVDGAVQIDAVVAVRFRPPPSTSATTEASQVPPISRESGSACRNIS